MQAYRERLRERIRSGSDSAKDPAPSESYSSDQDQLPLTLSCLCGSSQFTLPLPISVFPLENLICHCETCRHCTGTPCTTYLQIPSGYGAELDPSKLSYYDTSKAFRRYFCGSCGTHMLIKRLDGDEHVQVASGVVAAGGNEDVDELFSYVEHEFIEDTKDGGCSDWIEEVKGQKLKRWRTNPEESEELPVGWTDLDTGPSEDFKTRYADKSLCVQAHCQCKGVSFSIGYPDSHSTEATSGWPDLLIPFHSMPNPPPDPAPWWLRRLQARGNDARYLAGTCACRSCRLATGQEFIAWAFVPTVNITYPDGTPMGKHPREMSTLKSHRSSESAMRYFCSGCGATVFWDGPGRDGLVDVAVGLLNAEEGTRADTLLYWVRDRVSFEEEEHDKGLIQGLKTGLGDELRRYAVEERVKKYLYGSSAVI